MISSFLGCCCSVICLMATYEGAAQGRQKAGDGVKMKGWRGVSYTLLHVSHYTCV